MELTDFVREIGMILSSFGYRSDRDGTKSKGFSVCTEYRNNTPGGDAKFNIKSSGDGFFRVDVMGCRSNITAESYKDVPNLLCYDDCCDGQSHIVITSLRLPMTVAVIPAMLGWVGKTNRQYAHLVDIAKHDLTKGNAIRAEEKERAKHLALVSMTQDIKNTVTMWFDRGFTTDDLNALVREAQVEYTMKS